MVHPAERVLRIEAQALAAAADRIDHASYLVATKLLADASGPLVTTGVGTSGVVARKMAATFTSTGTRATFLHPSDALHGQLGLLQRRDVVVAVSNSGETEEILAALPYLHAREAQIIAIVGNPTSTLARNSAVVLDAYAEVEACPLDLAPTSTTTLALAVGDALAVKPDDPQGHHRRRVRTQPPVGAARTAAHVVGGGLMQPVSELGSVAPSTALLDVLANITSAGVGAALVVENDQLMGLVTDGDVRRGLAELGSRPLAEVTASDLMTAQPEVVGPDEPAYSALVAMEQRPSQISVLPVVDGSRVLGLVRLHDLVRSGL